MNVLPQKEYYEEMPKKAVCAAVIFRNQKNEFLAVNPTYKNYWILVGGVTEKNESLFDGLKREVKEELGVELKTARLFCIDYKSTAGDKLETYQCVFDGGILNNDKVAKIILPKEELSAFAFFSKEEFFKKLGDKMVTRLTSSWQAFEEQSFIYLEDGKPVPEV